MSESEKLVFTGPGFYRTRDGRVELVVGDSGNGIAYPLYGPGGHWNMHGLRAEGYLQGCDLIGGRLVSWPPSDWSRFEGGEVQAVLDVKPKPISVDAMVIATMIARVANRNGTVADAIKLVDEVVAAIMSQVADEEDGEAEGGA